MIFDDFIAKYKEKDVFNGICLNYNGENLNYFLHDLKLVYSFNYLIDIIACDLINEDFSDGKRFCCIFQLRNLETNLDLFVKVKTNKIIQEDEFDAFESGDWFLREIYDLFGVSFEKIPLRLFTTRNFQGHAFLKDFKFQEDSPEDSLNYNDVRNKTVILSERIKESWQEYKPENCGDHNFYRMHVDTYGEVMSRTHFEVGYTHTGIEKSLESLNPVVACTLVDQISPQSLCHASFLYSYTVEDMLGIEISERAQMLRVIFLEFGRINNHLYSLINLFKYQNIQTYLKTSIELKDRIQVLCQRISGNRYLQSFITIGGLKNDLPLGWSSDCIDFVTHGLRHLNQMLNGMTANKFLVEVINDKSISPSQAIQNSLTGPLLRSTGINYDLRKARPFYIYQDLNFDVPIGIHGKNYDLLIIKLLESIQSLKIIVQLLDNLPTGVVATFKNDKAAEAVAGLINESRNSSRRDISRSIESGNGEMSLYISRANSGDFFNRVKFRTPSFVNLAGMEKLLKGYSVTKYNDLASLSNFQVSEVDR